MHVAVHVPVRPVLERVSARAHQQPTRSTLVERRASPPPLIRRKCYPCLRTNLLPMSPTAQPLRGRAPIHRQLASLLRTVPQVEVDQGLVWNAGEVSHSLEILDRRFVKSYGDLLLEPLSVGVLARFRKVVLLLHRLSLSQYCFPSGLLARRALMIRTNSPPSRRQWHTRSSRSAELNPMRTNRSSGSSGSGSSSSRPCSSEKTVWASSNDTPCFRSFDRAFWGSQEKCSPATHYIVTTCRKHFKASAPSASNTKISSEAPWLAPASSAASCCSAARSSLEAPHQRDVSDGTASHAEMAEVLSIKSAFYDSPPLPKAGIGQPLDIEPKARLHARRHLDGTQRIPLELQCHVPVRANACVMVSCGLPDQLRNGNRQRRPPA